MDKIKYVGHIFTKSGIVADPERVETIQQIESPKNAKELGRFLGMITYLGKFIPNLAKETANLRTLTKKILNIYGMKNMKNNLLS